MKIKNNQSGIAHLATIFAVVVIAAIGVVGWKVWDTTKSKPKPVSNTATKSTAGQTEYFTVKEWGIRMPITKAGRFIATLGLSSDSSIPSAPMASVSDSTLQYVGLDIAGFTKDENKCANPTIYNKNGSVVTTKELYFTGTQIYRHKDEDPTITYQGTSSLSGSAPVKVKLNGWWYSLREPDSTGSCFEGITTPLPKDYTALTKNLVENFKKLEEY